MINVTFVCLGNICRSPMAELIFRKLIEERGVAGSFRVTSFGTSDCEEGNPVYPPAARTLRERGVDGTHRARMISKRDVINSDYVLVMDSSNLFDLLRLTGGECSDKIYKLRSFTPTPNDVADPWYTRDFDRAFEDIYEGCECFLDFVLKQNAGAIDYDKQH